MSRVPNFATRERITAMTLGRGEFRSGLAIANVPPSAWNQSPAAGFQTRIAVGGQRQRSYALGSNAPGIDAPHRFYGPRASLVLFRRSDKAPRRPAPDIGPVQALVIPGSTGLLPPGLRAIGHVDPSRITTPGAQ